MNQKNKHATSRLQRSLFGVSFLLCLYATEPVLAQLNFGPTFGPVTSIIRGDKDLKSIGRYYGGAMANYNLFRYGMCLQAELNFVGSGASRADNGPVTNYRLHTGYITVPLLVKMRMRQRFHMGFGYQYSLLVGANERYNFLGNARDLDASNRLSNNDAGVLAEIGYQAIWGFGTYLRYYRGGHRINLEKGPDLYNQWIQVGFFYAFGEKPEPIPWRRSRRF